MTVFFWNFPIQIQIQIVCNSSWVNFLKRIHRVADTVGITGRQTKSASDRDRSAAGAAEQLHSQGGWFETKGQFPSDQLLDFPLNQEAARFYKYGPPLLQRFLPFWAASLIDRLKIMLLPLVVLLMPVFKIMPPLYQWRMRSRIYRWYRELEAVNLSWS